MYRILYTSIWHVLYSSEYCIIFINPYFSPYLTLILLVMKVTPVTNTISAL